MGGGGEGGGGCEGGDCNGSEEIGGKGEGGEAARVGWRGSWRQRRCRRSAPAVKGDFSEGGGGKG